MAKGRSGKCCDLSQSYRKENINKPYFISATLKGASPYASIDGLVGPHTSAMAILCRLLDDSEYISYTAVHYDFIAHSY